MRKLICRVFPCALRGCASSATPPPPVAVRDAAIDGVSIIEIYNPPVNILSGPIMTTMLEELRRLAAPEAKCRGIILSSALPTTFSAGLDLNILYTNFNENVFREYYALFQEMFVILHRYPHPIVAAVNGTAPGAGCALALCSDYRVMARHANQPNGKSAPFRIGITVARAGFAAPTFLDANLALVVGERPAERLLTSGAMLTADEALRMGLVDEVVEERSEVLPAAEAEVERMLKDNPAEFGRWLVKDQLRRPIVELLGTEELRKKDADDFMRTLRHPKVMSHLDAYMKALSKRKK
jgi:3,2-trans-enoyl-CoA isomerase